MNSELSKGWNRIIAQFPQTSILQTYHWGEVKSRFGWNPTLHLWLSDLQRGQDNSSGLHVDHRVIPFRGQDTDLLLDTDKIVAASLVLMREIPIRGLAYRPKIYYAPKGPLLLDWTDQDLRKRVIDDLTAYSRQKRAIFLKIDPDVVIGYGETNPDEDSKFPGRTVIQALEQDGWVYSSSQIQFKNTMLLDLTPPEEDILAGMKQKTRYNIRLSERKGVTVRKGDEADFDLLFDMYQETSARDGFVIRDRTYYHTVWRTFSPERSQGNVGTPSCIPLIAEVDGQPVAALMLFIFGKSAWYIYGMSTSLHRKLMPNYLLQWEAILQAKRAGCQVYDLWGAPDVFDESDDMWGVYRFKTGLGSKIMRTIGAWDYPVRPLFYRLYTGVIPRILDIMRSRRMREINRPSQSFD